MKNSGAKEKLRSLLRDHQQGIFHFTIHSFLLQFLCFYIFNETFKENYILRNIVRV